MTDTATASVKPGWKTTEYWLSKATIVLGALLSAGVFGDGSTALRIAGAAAAVLAQLGYTASRTIAKAGTAP